MGIALSLVIIAHNMERELPRTIRSLLPPIQRDTETIEFEIIVVDNGSTPPLDPNKFAELAPNIAITKMLSPGRSPVEAVNLGLKQAQGDLIGVWIDGARLASPRILSLAVQASKTCMRPVIGTVGLHLGRASQKRAEKIGYTQEVEDALLEGSRWTEDGYRLFEISVMPFLQESWFGSMRESNALFMKREHWQDLRGYDTSFVSPGGGRANLDMWRRACESDNSTPIILLGEGTFHQFHGGVTTNVRKSPIEEFELEYQSIRGSPYESLPIEPLYFGYAQKQSLPEIAQAAVLASRAPTKWERAKSLFRKKKKDLSE